MKKSKILIFITTLSLLLSGLNLPSTDTTVSATKSCPDLKIIFARGSGGTLNEDSNYLTWKSSLEEKLQTTTLNYEFIDLDYPAVAVGLDHFNTSIGALVSGGESYTFGDSVNSGVQKITEIVNNSACDTKYVIGGYSQGAMVISKSLSQLDADKIIYAATFGDPKLYLPEGEGFFPDACRGQNLSDYRVYVPDCHTYEGLLGSFQPYEPEDFIGKLGTWCNKSDIFCSSHLSLPDHLSYVSDDLYNDAAKVIFDKITETFNIENNITSLHNTAILIDSTGSMSSLIDKYKAEALRLAKETLESGGRVALYDYRDLSDPYEPVERCSFETCTLETFSLGLSQIQANGGGDIPESLLSAALHVMQEQTWQYGATKSLVVLTDANYLSPDRDGVTLEQVVQLSKTIDPVNFYIITPDYNASIYTDLTTKTDGQVYTSLNDLSLLTDFIMARYDSLPRVIEETTTTEYATITIDQITTTSDSATISFQTDAEQVLISLNDLVLGLTTDQQITLNDLDYTQINTLRLTPYKNDTRGISIEETLTLPAPTTISPENTETKPVIPKAPDTGQVEDTVL